MDDDLRKSFFRITVYSHLDNDFTSFISDRCLIDSFSDRLANITDMTVILAKTSEYHGEERFFSSLNLQICSKIRENRENTAEIIRWKNR